MSAQATATAATATAPQREGKRPRLAKSRAEGLNVVVAGGGIAGMWISMLRCKYVCCKVCVWRSLSGNSLTVTVYTCTCVCAQTTAGLAVAVALQRRGCNNVVVYERDESFDQRPQGYGAWQHMTIEASAHSKLVHFFILTFFLSTPDQPCTALAALCHSHSHRRSRARIYSRVHLLACSLKLAPFVFFFLVNS
jgi:hypothetical protein